MTKINYDAEAARLISEWNKMSQSDQDFLPRYQGDEEIPVTVYPDDTFSLGHRDGGTWTTSDNDLDYMTFVLMAGVEVTREAERLKAQHAEEDAQWAAIRDEMRAEANGKYD